MRFLNYFNNESMMWVAGTCKGWRQAARVGCLAAMAVASSPINNLSSARAADTYRSLSTAELKKLLTPGASFRSLPFGMSSGADKRELFHPGGRYEGCGDLAVIEARYAVRDARLCLEDGKHSPSCRQVLRAPTGEYREQWVRADGSVLPHLDVQISPLRANESCFSKGEAQ